MASSNKKVNSRARARKKELTKEKFRYELRRRVKKGIKKQINNLFSLENGASYALSVDELQEKKKALSSLYKTLDSKESKGLITKGRANRLKSKCTIKFNQLFLNQDKIKKENKSEKA
ncbi:30S ribosomal protein S20 [Mycoplasma parvum]|uniref:Small ribosomal subunit protein bS20 n=1 Tax=Mycoplasma parvum str. Indiana TaxID=1403316 RepID=U5NBT3_9MOLU|nr:30S ribosomal protein S20 [Mycoplasma parvum]AGX89026.1 hypothetical protein PRV_01325 [Mycoplasma parvum str. Indiana]